MCSPLLKSELIMAPAGLPVTLRLDDPDPKGHLLYVPAG